MRSHWGERQNSAYLTGFKFSPPREYLATYLCTYTGLTEYEGRTGFGPVLSYNKGQITER